MEAQVGIVRRIFGGVDTHKDLHVAAVVDEQDRVLGTQSFASTRQGYRQMLAWMRSFGEVKRVGVESTGSYGHSKLEAIRCLKRYIAREVFILIKQRQKEINQTQIAA